MEPIITNKQLDIIFQDMTEREFNHFLSLLPDDLKDFFIMRKALVKLFSDREYYEAVKSAVCSQIKQELFPNKEATP